MSKFDKTSKPSRPAAKTRTAQSKSGGGTLLGMFIGLVIGVSIAFGVVWYLNKSPSPFQNKFEGGPRPDKETPAAPGGTANAPQAPASLPGKPGDKPVDGQRFDFYKILEGKQPGKSGAATGAPASPAPATAPTPAAPVVAATPAKPAAGEIFFLQVGAFQKATDADNLKAKLALSGLEAAVQEVSIPEKGTLHRVRVGPFRNPEELARARAQLAQAGVEGSVVRQKD
jgi:cell division septation protein DedD